MSVFVCKERYGSSGGIDKEFYISPGKPRSDVTSTDAVHKLFLLGQNPGEVVVKKRSSHSRSFLQIFESVFLPQGYPDSVSDDYLAYQIWDTIQAFASSITGTLATRAVLQGYGVGDETATATAATITWILKDGTGMLGRILFAWHRGSSLDCDAKRWRFFADILNDVAISLDIVAPYFKDYFTPIVCFAGLCRSIVGVAGGATRAALTQHQARRNNLADVSAKDGSQETMVNLAALLCSMVLLPHVSDNNRLIWLCYLFFTALHIFANYKAVTVVTMETISQTRLNIIMQYFMSRDNYIPSVKLVNHLEPVLWGIKRKFSINLGASYKQLLTRSGWNWKLDRGLCLIQDADNRYILRCKRRTISIVLSSRCNKEDELKACFQAEVLNLAQVAADQGLRSQVMCCPNLLSLIEALKSRDTPSIEYHLQMITVKHFMKFLPGLEIGGWTLSPMLLGADEWRADWDHK